MTARITKEALYELLNKDMSLTVFLCSVDADADAVNTMFSSSQEFDLDSDVINYQLIPLLIYKGVIDKRCIDRIQKKRTELHKTACITG